MRKVKGIRKELLKGRAVFYCYSPSIDRMVAVSEQVFFGMLERIEQGKMTAGEFLDEYRVQEQYQIVRAVQLSDAMFDVFANNLQSEYCFITESETEIGYADEVWKCLAVHSPTRKQIILVSTNPANPGVRHIAKINNY